MKYKENLIGMSNRQCFKFRYDPVPYISHWINPVRSYYRKPQLLNEIKQAYTSPISIRMKRGISIMKHLLYSEPVISDNRTRSWKRSKKKKQWL